MKRLLLMCLLWTTYSASMDSASALEKGELVLDQVSDTDETQIDLFEAWLDKIYPHVDASADATRSRLQENPMVAKRRIARKALNNAQTKQDPIGLLKQVADLLINQNQNAQQANQQLQQNGQQKSFKQSITQLISLAVASGVVIGLTFYANSLNK